MVIYYVPLWLCSLNLIIQLFSNFTNTNMSSYALIPMIKIQIWISKSLVVSGPSIKFDWVWSTLTKLWPRFSINPVDCDHNLLELSFYYTLRIQRLNFKSKDGAWWTYIMYLYGYVLSILSSNCSQISPIFLRQILSCRLLLVVIVGGKM